jgi:rhodanese-related sulfurtransferase
MTEGPPILDALSLRNWLADGDEIAFVDVREEGQHGAGHPLLAVNIPYSRLEIEVQRLVPRPSCRIVLLDDADGVAAAMAAYLRRETELPAQIAADGLAGFRFAVP